MPRFVMRLDADRRRREVGGHPPLTADRPVVRPRRRIGRANCDQPPL